MSLFLNMFLPLKLSIMLRYLAGMLLFSWKVPKKKYYWGIVISWSLFCYVVAALLPILKDNFYIYQTNPLILDFRQTVLLKKLDIN